MVQKTVVIEKKMMKLFSSVPRKYLNRMLNDLEMEIETMAEVLRCQFLFNNFYVANRRY